MHKILITGHRGFIAGYLIKQLEQEYEILTIRDNLFEVDFSAYMEEHKPEYLIHLAWVTGAGYLNSMDNLRMVAKSIEMYEAFYLNGGKRSVYVGTEQEYQRQEIPLREDALCQPQSLYAKCKYSLGDMLVRYSQEHGNGFVWNRLFFIYGIGEKPKRLMPSMIKGVIRGEEVTCSYHDYVRDYLSVEDVASGIIVSLFSDYTGAVNICGGRNTTIGEIGSIIEGFAEVNGLIHYRSHEECGQDRIIQGDNKLLQSLGWKQKYSLIEGLRQEYEYYQRMYADEQRFLDE